MLTEWHLSPDYIIDNWTDELLELMTEKLVERKQCETGTIKELSPEDHSVSAETLSSVSGGIIKVVKK